MYAFLGQYEGVSFLSLVGLLLSRVRRRLWSPPNVRRHARRDFCPIENSGLGCLVRPSDELGWERFDGGWEICSVPWNSPFAERSNEWLWRSFGYRISYCFLGGEDTIIGIQLLVDCVYVLIFLKLMTFVTAMVVFLYTVSYDTLTIYYKWSIHYKSLYLCQYS